MSRDYYRGIRESSYMETQRLLAAEHVWMVNGDGAIRKLGPQEFREALDDPTVHGVRFFLRERDAKAEGAERSAKKGGAPAENSSGFTDFLDRLRGGSIWLVDGAGAVHALSVTAYSSLPESALAGSRVFLLEESARKYSRDLGNTGADSATKR